MLDTEPITTWERDGFKLVTWDTGRRDERGSTTQRYEFSHDGVVIFSGEDFQRIPDARR